MGNLVATIRGVMVGEREQRVGLNGVQPFVNPSTGRQDYALTAEQAAYLLNTWTQVTLSNVFHADGANSPDWAWSLERPDWESPRVWQALGSTPDLAGNYWALSAFPAPIYTRVRLGDAEALDRIVAFMSRPGPVNGGDLVEVVTEIVNETGRAISDDEWPW